MAADSNEPETPVALFSKLIQWQSDAAREALSKFFPSSGETTPDGNAMASLAQAASEWQERWLAFHQMQSGLSDAPLPLAADPEQWLEYTQAWYGQFPAAAPERQAEFWSDMLSLWDKVLENFDSDAPDTKPADFPFKDRRFADERWRSNPAFALLHQTYLKLADSALAMVDEVEGLNDQEREQLRFATRSSLEAMSPANFPMLNPLVIDRTIEQHGENLVKGMEHFAADLEKGQLTHTDASTFKLGENIAATPGKVILERPLYQLIQYTPTTDKVLEVPLVIFPPWINRFYILDLNPAKSFVKWALDQGVSLFMVSWKSADESMADITWDDYIRAQIEVIDHIRERLAVPSVHTVGYCVAGTTLAATLAILAQREQADKVASATFLTAQVDFQNAGDLKVFIDDKQLDMIRQASTNGFLDGRYMAATFNLLRGTDLIWNYVIRNYLMGEDYQPFDLLYWNSDVTNLPSKWHLAYLQDLYRDNLLVEPDALSADGTPINLNCVLTPSYIQAGCEDHIAPPESVFRMTEHLSGPLRFVLAGSGHIAGVINPPAAGKYQYWTNDGDFSSLDGFRKGATEHAGSWWPDWMEWLTAINDRRVPAKGKRKPGGRGDKVIEDAPGSYVRMR